MGWRLYQTWSILPLIFWISTIIYIYISFCLSVLSPSYCLSCCPSWSTCRASLESRSFFSTPAELRELIYIYIYTPISFKKKWKSPFIVPGLFLLRPPNDSTTSSHITIPSSHIIGHLQCFTWIYISSLSIIRGSSWGCAVLATCTSPYLFSSLQLWSCLFGKLGVSSTTGPPPHRCRSRADWLVFPIFYIDAASLSSFPGGLTLGERFASVTTIFWPPPWLNHSLSYRPKSSFW